MVTVKSDKHFYGKASLTNTDFEQEANFHFGSSSNGMIIFNDSKEIITFSFNGRDIHGEIYPTDKWWALDKKQEYRIWLKTSAVVTGGSSMRIVAWV